MATPVSQASVTGPHSASPARAAVEVIAVTSQDDFLLELGQALGGQASVQPVESTAQALELLGRSKSLQILAVDSRELSDLREQIETVQTQAPQLTILVFAPAETNQDIAAELKGTKVFAVLPVPIDARQTAAVFGGALAEAKTKQSTSRSANFARNPPLTVEPATLQTPQPIRPEPGETSGGMNPRLIIMGAVALVAVAGGAIWFFMRSPNPEAAPSKNSAAATQTAAEAPAVVAPPAIETSIVAGTVDELLEKARTAMRERRYTEPTGDNALLYYRSAAAAEPGNGEALDGLNRVAAVLATRCDEALTAGHLDEAATTLAQLKSATPNDARLAGFETRLNGARKELARQQEEAKRKQREAEEAAAREAAAAERKAAATRAAQAEADRQAQLAREKAEAEAKQKAAEQAAKAAQESAAKQKDNAARTAPSQSSLKRKRYIAPDYPQSAYAKRIGGVVTIEFTVDVKGEPRDVRVVKADPPNVFDRAAIDAVKRWRYEPPVVDGVPTEVPVRMAIRFTAPE